MADKKPIPRSAREISQQQITPYTNMGKSWLKNKKARENQISVKDSKVKNFAVGLRDIDESIMYYFNEVIKPSVIQNGSKMNVPSSTDHQRDGNQYKLTDITEINKEGYKYLLLCLRGTQLKRIVTLVIS